MSFTGLTELLHIANLFVMENLAEEVVQRFVVTKENYLKVSQAANMSNIVNTDTLVTKCVDFVCGNIGEGLLWAEIGKLGKVMSAFGKRAEGKYLVAGGGGGGVDSNTEYRTRYSGSGKYLVSQELYQTLDGSWKLYLMS